MEWSRGQIHDAARRGAIYVNPIIYAELAPAFASAGALGAWLDPTLFRRMPLPFEAAWIAADAVVKYRRSGGQRHSPLPDFYIGAHAAVAGFTIVTRDPGRYRTYFPNVALITPE